MHAKYDLVCWIELFLIESVANRYLNHLSILQHILRPYSDCAILLVLHYYFSGLFAKLSFELCI
jgi:hypothetical protein